MPDLKVKPQGNSKGDNEKLKRFFFFFTANKRKKKHKTKEGEAPAMD